MKVSKLDGLGSYGTIIDNFNWRDPASYDILKKVNLKSLVTVVRGYGKDNFPALCENFNRVVKDRIPGSKWILRYGRDWQNCLTDEDLQAMQATKEWVIADDKTTGWNPITAKKAPNGLARGIYGGTELNWHSDETYNPTFAPVVALYGVNNMKVTHTSFLQTADWYEAQSESFRSEIHELIAIHKWDSEVLQPGVDVANQIAIKSSIMPDGYAETPLVVTSPGGINGINFSLLITGFKDVPEAESARILDYIRQTLFNREYMYSYFWEHNQGDLVLFDQSITMHSRKVNENLDVDAELKKRLVYRNTGDYAGMSDYNPYHHEAYSNARRERIALLDDEELLNSLKRNPLP
jgi:alpha-ketoglutarate-dependent taurine dioxygenase